jgi:hypothetical protein
MPDFFYSCADCPEHTYTFDMRPGMGLRQTEHCDLNNKNFTKSWPLKNRPCKDVLLCADHECPECGKTMSLYYSRKAAYFACEEHGMLQEDGSVKPIAQETSSEAKQP